MLFPLPVCIATTLRSRCLATSCVVGSAIPKTVMVENMGVDVEIPSASLSVQKLILCSLWAVAMLDFPLPVFAESNKCGSKNGGPMK